VASEGSYSALCEPYGPANALGLRCGELWSALCDKGTANPKRPSFELYVLARCIAVECNAGQAEEVRAWLEKAMIEGMDAILYEAGEVHVAVEVEAQIY
jgi:hypothetical protein